MIRVLSRSMTTQGRRAIFFQHAAALFIANPTFDAPRKPKLHHTPARPAPARADGAFYL
jgi:hypothetical protein